MRTLAPAVLALALALTLPLADARMVIAPKELTLRGGESGAFTIQLFNTAGAPVRFMVELRAQGLETSVDPPGAIVPPGASAVLDARVRSPAAGPRNATVDVVLYERDSPQPVETQRVLVHVTADAAPVPRALPLPQLAAAGLAGAAAGALVGLALWRRWHLLGAALYTRLRREALAEHPSRARILGIVRASPGASLSEVQTASGLANGPFEHHVRKLVEGGRLSLVEEGRFRFLRLPDAAAPLGPGTTAGAIESLVAARGEVRARDVARELGLSRQVVHYHLRRLTAEGRVEPRIVQGRIVLKARSRAAP